MRFTTITLLVVLLAGIASAQTQQQLQNPTWKRTEAVPMLTGYTGFSAGFRPGVKSLEPSATPILLVPFGEKWLVEAEGEFENEFEYEGGGWNRVYGKEVEYLQLDFLANRYLTVVSGRFLTPFGIYNERLHPGWIKNLSQAPMIAGIGSGSSNGGQLRGGIPLGRGLNLNYAGYFSAASSVRALGSERAAGSRLSLFFPNRRLEVGTSFQRTLMEERFNSYGADLTWQLSRIPLDVRAEFARNGEQGSGYWLEGAYRLNSIPVARGFFRRSQLVLREEQFFIPAGGAPAAGGHDSAFPDEDTTAFTVGWNYFIKPDLRLTASAGRYFNDERDRNAYSVGITYRFSLPLGKERK